jgi:hypothetical protein
MIGKKFWLFTGASLSALGTLFLFQKMKTCKPNLQKILEGAIKIDSSEESEKSMENLSLHLQKSLSHIESNSNSPS